MPQSPDLVILGASARAAAFSAIRAGYRPWCADLFADSDLRACARVTRVAGADYPHGFVRLLSNAPDCPWIYTGALENRPRLIQQLARIRPLWGNASAVLRTVRSPRGRTALFEAAGISCPKEVPSSHLSSSKRWLLKPVAGAGGAGIASWPMRGGALPRKGFYLQEFIDGPSCAAVYLGMDGKAVLLGVTRQLVGVEWLHARPFHYCGSIGPLPVSPALRLRLERLGQALATSGLRGLFGVDFIARNDEPWPVEVNPRYTASVEVLEHALAFRALAFHAAAFDPGRGYPAEPATIELPTVGKAILFACADTVMPADGPWSVDFPAPSALPSFADIPPAGQTIARGRPVLTVFSTGESMADCEKNLQRKAGVVAHFLFDR